MSRILEVLGFGLGATELLIILAILTLIFGASRIPDLGRSLGSGIRGFQKSLKDEDEPKQLGDQGQSQSGTPTPARTDAPATAEGDAKP